jgi:hypothetical protein
VIALLILVALTVPALRTARDARRRRFAERMRWVRILQENEGLDFYSACIAAREIVP